MASDNTTAFLVPLKVTLIGDPQTGEFLLPYFNSYREKHVSQESRE